MSEPDVAWAQAALIPIVNMIVLLRIADRSPWNVLLVVIPVVSWIASFVMWIAVAKTFGRSAWFGVGLTLLTPIFHATSW